MSRDDAPNLRSIDPNRTCDTCNNSLRFYDAHQDNFETRCGKYDFVILDSLCLVCDGWEEET